MNIYIFELKIALPTAKKRAHATALTENVINWLKGPTISKYLFENFPNFQKFENGKAGGLIYLSIYAL